MSAVTYTVTAAIYEAAKVAHQAERKYLLARQHATEIEQALKHGRVTFEGRRVGNSTLRAAQRGVQGAFADFQKSQEAFYRECEHSFHFVEAARKQLLEDLESIT